MPLEAGLRCHLYRRHLTTLPLAQNNNDIPSSYPNDTSESDSSVINDYLSTEDDIPTDRIPPAVNTCPLQRLNLDCLKMTLEKYLTKRGSDDEKFHLVLGDPSQLQLNGTCKVFIDEKKADKYAGILKSMVREHGWVFFYTCAVDFARWTKAFKAHGFEILPCPWIMVRDTDTIQANTSPIPQNITELLIGARRAGTGPPAHQPDITTSYNRSISSRRRKFAVMDNCPESRLKVRKLNSREPLRSNQRSAEPIAEFLQTFCPAIGYVLDAFAGTMETAKACYMTGRKCVTLEADEACFDIAIETLKENASAYIEQTTQGSVGAIRNPALGFKLPETARDGGNGVVPEMLSQQSPGNENVNEDGLDEQETANLPGASGRTLVSPLTSDGDDNTSDS